jgi:hypothetical protein
VTAPPLDPVAVDALRRAALRFGGEHTLRKSAALARCAAGGLTDPAALLAYHDCLLCLLAYPETRALVDTTRAELKRVATAARAIDATGSARSRARLANTGLAWTPVTINFGWDIARWLVDRFPRRADIDSFGDDGIGLQAILASALPAMEFELAAAEESSSEFLERASASRAGTQLAWLVRAFERLPADDALREHLFDTLQAFIAIQPGASMLSRTFVRGLPAPIFFHRESLLRQVDPRPIVDSPLPPPRRLSPRERWHVVDAGRAMLAALGRETDAIALSYADGVRWFDLARGVALALYTMRPDRRSPIDSHVGMMLFKNGIPMGYGGGWPFLGTCRIGVNIFPPFRGGESAYLFTQVLRVYRQQFAVGRFIAEPSQFGGTNAEGLRSGAFWFYYRLGFRPVERKGARLAAEEWARIAADPHYRTPLASLRRFTGSDIEWRLNDVPDCEPASLSDAVTGWISRYFHGDRAAAERAAVRKVARALGTGEGDRWSDNERQAFIAWAPLVGQIPGLSRWPSADKRALVAVMRAKGGSEFRFHDRLSRHRRLRGALEALAGGARRKDSPAHAKTGERNVE